MLLPEPPELKNAAFILSRGVKWADLVLVKFK